MSQFQEVLNTNNKNNNNLFNLSLSHLNQLIILSIIFYSVSQNIKMMLRELLDMSLLLLTATMYVFASIVFSLSNENLFYATSETLNITSVYL